MIFWILLAGSEVLVYSFFIYEHLLCGEVLDGLCGHSLGWTWSSTWSCPHRGVGGWGHGTLETQPPLETSNQSQF